MRHGPWEWDGLCVLAVLLGRGKRGQRGGVHERNPQRGTEALCAMPMVCVCLSRRDGRFESPPVSTPWGRGFGTLGPGVRS